MECKVVDAPAVNVTGRYCQTHEGWAFKCELASLRTKLAELQAQRDKVIRRHDYLSCEVDYCPICEMREAKGSSPSDELERRLDEAREEALRKWWDAVEPDFMDENLYDDWLAMDKKMRPENY